LNEISRSFSAFGRFFLAETFYRRWRVFVCTENRTREVTFSSSQMCPYYLPKTPQHFFWESSAVIWLWISIFIDYFLCISFPFGTEILELFTLSISVLFEFNSVLFLLLLFYVIYFISDKKRFLCFSKLNIFFIFSLLGSCYKIAEEVISTEKVYEWSTVVKALIEGSSEISSSFWELRNYP